MKNISQEEQQVIQVQELSLHLLEPFILQ